MTDDDRQWLQQLADALDKARRYQDRVVNGKATVSIALSDELARSVADRLRSIAERDAIVPP